MKQKDLTGLFAGERPYIFPVIHVLSTEQTAGNIETVLQHGVSGVCKAHSIAGEVLLLLL